MSVVVPSNTNEYREALLKLGVDEGAVASLNKKRLEALYSEMTSKNNTDKIAFAFEEPEPAMVLEKISDALPEYGSLDWQKYVLAQLRPDEVVDGFPKCAGLRRLANKILGPIVSCGAKHISVIPQMTASDTPTRAVTVSYEVVIDWRLDRSIMMHAAMSQPMFRTFGGVSDCIEEANNVFGKHPAASAETKAESRALKKALGLNVLSFEEKISGYDEKAEEAAPTNRITKQLTDFITGKVETLRLNIDDVLTKFGVTCKLNELNMDEGRKLFQFINTYQQNKK